MIWKDEAGRQRRRVANLEDISQSGACLQVENPIPDGTAISMRYGNGQFSGSVRYCLNEGMGYFLGIQFAEGCRWSRKNFKPQHLLDLKQLVKSAARRSRAKVEVRG